MKSQREKEGWRGPVHTVFVEMANFVEDGDKQSLGPRVPLFSVTYDPAGKRCDETTHYTELIDSHTTDYDTRYDAKGRVSEQSYYRDGMFQYKVLSTYQDEKVVTEDFCAANSTPNYKREHKYDAEGNPIEMSYSEAGGKLIYKLKYDNEYDSAGNLIKITIFQWTSEQGEELYKPLSVHFQTITYY
jgi:hypothetical protein